MMVCFPSVAILVACCPDEAAVSPEENGCPEQFLSLRNQCCDRRVLHAIIEQLGSLTPEEVARAMPAENYAEVVSAFVPILGNYLRDSDALDMHAWRMFSVTSIQSALWDVDSVKDKLLQMQTLQDAASLFREAVACSRKLGRALFRAENYHALLLSHISHAEGEKLQGFDPEKIRTAFDPVLERYLSGMRMHDYFMYSVLPDLRQVARPSHKGVSSFDSRIASVALMVVSLGEWAKTGFLTLWSILRHRSTHLRIFVLGDPLGLDNWQKAVEELRADAAGKLHLRGVDFEYVDFAAQPAFQDYIARYPKDCSFGAAGQAILARVVCHLVLPADVQRVVSLDLGDTIVFDDIKQLWDIGDHMEEHHLMAAAHAVALSHVNGGVVVYDLARMRARNFTEQSLGAVRDSLRANKDDTCLRDQAIINVLHFMREDFGYEGPSPVMLLPCRWSVFPATEWQQGWNSPEMWLEEVVERKRYPGLVSKDRVEVFCPDEHDLLAAWAFIPFSTADESRQARLRQSVVWKGRKRERYCSRKTVGSRCCQCSESVALLHVAGDMKTWPSMRNLLHAYMPPWQEPPPQDAFLRSSSRSWWGGEARLQRVADETELVAIKLAKQLGLTSIFDRCMTLVTQATDSVQFLKYADIHLRHLQVPLTIDVETTAERDAYVLLGVGGHSGLELAMSEDGRDTACFRWIRSSPGSEGGGPWTARGDLACLPFASPKTKEDEDTWRAFSLSVAADGKIQVQQGSLEWGSYLSAEIMEILNARNLTFSVGSFGSVDRKWAVCKGQGST